MPRSTAARHPAVRWLPFLLALLVAGPMAGADPVAAPVFTPAPGSFAATRAVAIASPTGGVRIRYTMDGSDPDGMGALDYAGPVVLHGTTTLRARAVATDGTASAISAGTFTRTTVPGDRPPSRVEAVRFLNQATFGARTRDIDRLMALGYDGWFAEQLAMPYPSVTAFTDADTVTRRFEGRSLSSAFQTIAVQHPAQLRLRMWWALSQIIVVTELQSENISLKYWMDMLLRNAFTTYRSLIEEVTYHGSMGEMLTYIYSRDRPEQNVFPDQNYAREILQLFSIGLYRLNQDGSPVLDGQGQPIPAYTPADLVGLARVWTGLGPDYDDADPTRSYWTRYNRRMVWMYDWHSPREKRFLGTVIPASPNGASMPSSEKYNEVRTALDTIAGHANVPPFIGRLLIQRFTTSNPSPAYLSRVGAVFRDNGRGVRGDLAAVLRAILLDPEARDRTAVAASATWGKPREENLRALPLLRILHASSAEPGGGIYDLNPNFVIYGPAYSRIGQDAFKAPSVFNFYRPGFTPPLTRLGDQGMVAPELQTVDSLSYTYWSQFLGRSLDRDGTGPDRRGQTDGNTFDGDPRGFNRFDYRDFIAAAADPAALAALVDERLCSGLLPAADRNVLRDQAARIGLTDFSTMTGDPMPAATAALFETRSEVGMRVIVEVPGTIRAIRYYRPAGETGGHTGRIWSADGTLLAQAAFTGETASGWQTQALATPLPVVAGREYIVSVNVNREQGITPGDIAEWSNGVVRLPSDGRAQGRTSVYPLAFPSLNTRANHFRDVVFRPDSAAVAAEAAARIRIKRILFLAMMHPAFLIQK